MGWIPTVVIRFLRPEMGEVFGNRRLRPRSAQSLKSHTPEIFSYSMWNCGVVSDLFVDISSRNYQEVLLYTCRE